MIGRKIVREHVTTWVDRAIDVQDGAVRAHVAGVRDGVSGGATGEVTQALESQYLATVSGSGAVVGGAASVPGLGTGIAVGLSVAETIAFLDATALFTLAVAESHGCPVADLPRRRALLLLALLGDEAVALVPPAAAGKEVRGWGLRLADLPDDAVSEINRVAEKWLITRYGPRQSMFMLGRLAPFGIGAAVGAAGNAVTAKGVIARVRDAFEGYVPVVVAPDDVVADGVTPVDVVADGVTPVDVVGNDIVTDDIVTDDVTPDDVTPDDVVVEETPAVPPPSGKYAGLYTLLVSRPEDEVALRLGEVDAVVTGGLPATARRSPAWWTNVPGPRAAQASAWLAAGLCVSAVDLEGDTVRLNRAPALARADSPAGA